MDEDLLYLQKCLTIYVLSKITFFDMCSAVSAGVCPPGGALTYGSDGYVRTRLQK